MTKEDCLVMSVILFVYCIGFLVLRSLGFDPVPEIILFTGSVVSFIVFLFGVLNG